MNKKFLEIDEIIQYLNNNKKIIVSNDYRVFFNERNYISIINPYKELFAYGKDSNNNHIYKDYVDFSKYLDCVKQDEQLSLTLFEQISCFEKEFKNIVFETICKLYVYDDIKMDQYCIQYIKDIKYFIIRYYLLFPLMKLFKYKLFLPKPPIFCKNFYYTLSSSSGGYIKDKFLLKKKLSILLKIYRIGSGKESNGNILITHYFKAHKNIPLWIVPNALSLGELSIVFGMLDKKSQAYITSYFLNKSENDISNKQIAKFSSLLEQIRILRNTINHYEPLYPLLFNIKNKKIEQSTLFKAFQFLFENYANSKFANYRSCKEIDIKENDFNAKKIKILNKSQNIIQNKR